MSMSKKEIILKYVVEFVIVFLGVYIAFFLTAQKERKIQEQRRDQICIALVDEIKVIAKQGQHTSEFVEKLSAKYNKLIEAGEYPPLEPILLPLSFTPHMWNATIQSDGLNLLEVEKIEKIAWFYNHVHQVVEQINQLQELSKLYLLPNLEKGKEEFYDIAAKEVRPRYRWYFDIMQKIAGECKKITVEADSLIVEIGE